MNSVAELLSRVPLFGGLREDTLEFILGRATTVEFAAGESFFHEADIGSEIYVLAHGRVDVVKSRGSLSFKLMSLGPGDCFGEASLLAVMPRSATVTAVEDCEATCIKSAHLFALYERDVEQFAILVMNMGREVARRLWMTSEVLFGYVEFLSDQD